jgi:hypothetical protein
VHGDVHRVLPFAQEAEPIDRSRPAVRRATRHREFGETSSDGSSHSSSFAIRSSICQEDQPLTVVSRVDHASLVDAGFETACDSRSVAARLSAQQIFSARRQQDGECFWSYRLGTSGGASHYLLALHNSLRVSGLNESVGTLVALHHG